MPILPCLVIALTSEQVQHVLVLLWHVVLHFGQSALSLLNIVQLVVDLRDPQVDLLLVEVGIELDNLVEVREGRVEEATRPVDESEAIVGSLPRFRLIRISHIHRLVLVPS